MSLGSVYCNVIECQCPLYAARISAFDRYCCKSRKSIDSNSLAKVDLSTAARLCRGDTKVHGGFLCVTMWSLASPRAKRISGPKKFRSSAKKDFFNTADPERTWNRLVIRHRVYLRQARLICINQFDTPHHIMNFTLITGGRHAEARHGLRE